MRRIQGWDPLLIISQIISIQTIHYLVIALLLPPCLEAWTDKEALQYAGGSRVTGYVLDWREMASRSTAPVLPRHPPTEKERSGRRRPDRDRREIAESSVVFLERSEHSEDVLHLERSIKHIKRGQYLYSNTSINTSEHHPQLHPHRKRYTDHDPSHYAVTDEDETNYEVWDYGVSRTRGWIVAGVWVVVCLFE